VISCRSKSSTDDLHLDLPPPDLSGSAQLQTIANTNSLTVLILLTLVATRIVFTPQLTLVVDKDLTVPLRELPAY
jgi:hypothetical protein